MEDFLFDMGVSALLSSLRVAVKNPERARKIRNVCIKLANKIFETFPDDEALASSAGKYLGEK